MRNDCSENGKILESILQREKIDELTANEIAHLEKCDSCRNAYKRAQTLEQRLHQFARVSLEEIPVKSFKLPARSNPFLAKIREILTDATTAWRFSAALAGFTIFLIAVITIFSQVSPQAIVPILIKGELISSNGSNIAKGEIVNPFNNELKSPGLSKIQFAGYTLESDNAEFSLAENKVIAASGRFYFEVIPGNPLSVETPAIELQVTGTRFTVLVDSDGSTKVAVEDGSVRIRHIESSSQVILTGGQNKTFTKTRDIFHPQTDKIIKETAPAVLPDKNHKIEDTPAPASLSVESPAAAEDPILIQGSETSVIEIYQEEPPEPLTLDDLIH